LQNLVTNSSVVVGVTDEVVELFPDGDVQRRYAKLSLGEVEGECVGEKLSSLAEQANENDEELGDEGNDDVGEEDNDEGDETYPLSVLPRSSNSSWSKKGHFLDCNASPELDMKARLGILVPCSSPTLVHSPSTRGSQAIDGAELLLLRVLPTRWNASTKPVKSASHFSKRA